MTRTAIRLCAVCSFWASWMLWASIAYAVPAADLIAARRAELARTHGPRAIVELVAPGGLGSLEDGLLSTASSEDALGLFLRDAIRADDPLVAARARFELGKLLERRGDYKGADAVRAPLALIDSAALVGPFANDPGAQRAIEDALPPEAAIVSAIVPLDSTWASGIGAGAAHVRVLPPPNVAGLFRTGAALPGGVFPLGALLRPETQNAAYLIFGVHSSVARTVALRMGASGATAVWLNGRRIGGHVGDRPLAFDAEAYAAALVAGHNRFVVRIAVGDRQPEIVARLTELDGRPLPALRSVGIGALLGQVAPHAGVARGVARTLRGSLDALAKRDVAAALDRNAYVVFDELDGPAPDAACNGAGAASRLAAEVAVACAQDADERRRALEARLAKKGADAPRTAERIDLLTRLGTLALRGRTQARGEQLLQEAAALGSLDATVIARQRLDELDGDRGLPSVAWMTLSELAAAVPTRAVREALAQLAQRIGRRDDAERSFRALLKERPGDVSFRRQLASLVRTRGTPEALREALALLQPVNDLRDVVAVSEERADLEEGLGHHEQALAILNALDALIPDEARVEERIGRLLLALGRRSEALPHLRTALTLRPQSPELRGLLAEVDPERTAGADLWRRWRVDVAALRTQAAKDALGRGEPARVLYDGTTVRVHDNGLQDSFVERVIEIGDHRGAEREGEIAIRYAPSTQTVEVRLARIYKADGDVIDAATIDERDLSEPWYGLYYDEKAQVVGFTGLEPGDVIHVAYTVSDHGRRNELGESFGDLHMLQEEMPRLESAYRLIAPKRRALHFNEPRLNGDGAVIPVDTVDDGADRRYFVVARDVPGVRPEANMPGATELGAYVHTSTFASWAEVAAFYRTLLLPQLDADAEIRRAVQAAVRGKRTVEQKVAAIYDLVVTSTRYVGLEFGVHGYQPYRVAQVFARRFGDCKDKASLLVAMLREVGVPATVVLLRTRREGRVAPLPASLSTFDHAIAYVPSLNRYLDGTAEFSGSTELPNEDQGVAALHVDDGSLRTTPVLGPDAGTTDVALDVKLAADGSASVVDHRIVAGAAAEAWRRYYQAVGERKDHFESAWAQRSPGAIVSRVELPHLEDHDRPVELDAELHLPALARVDGDSLAMPVLAREPQLLSSYGRLSKREHDLDLPQAFTETEHLHVTLPSNASASFQPEAKLSSPFGSFSLVTRQTGDVVDIEAKTIIAVRHVSVADYPAFRKFCSDVDRIVGQSLRVEVKR